MFLWAGGLTLAISGYARANFAYAILARPEETNGNQWNSIGTKRKSNGNQWNAVEINEKSLLL